MTPLHSCIYFASPNWYLVSFMKIEDILKKNGKKITPERVRIFEQMQSMHLFESKDLVKVFPEIGRASIFRTLKLFVEIGAIRRVSLWEKSESYEVECCQNHHHEHMKCLVCGNILSFDSREICDKIFSEAAKLGFHISEHSLSILGKCRHCISV